MDTIKNDNLPLGVKWHVNTRSESVWNSLVEKWLSTSQKPICISSRDLWTYTKKNQDRFIRYLVGAEPLKFGSKSWPHWLPPVNWWNLDLCRMAENERKSEYKSSIKFKINNKEYKQGNCARLILNYIKDHINSTTALHHVKLSDSKLI